MRTIGENTPIDTRITQLRNKNVENVKKPSPARNLTDTIPERHRWITIVNPALMATNNALNVKSINHPVNSISVNAPKMGCKVIV